MDGPTETSNPPPLWRTAAAVPSSTSALAGHQAALKSGSMKFRILTILRERPATLWEVAAMLKVPDHVISGRFTEMANVHIEHAGERRAHPISGCPAEVWRVRGAANDPQPDWPAILGYPLSLKIEGDLFERQSLLMGAGGVCTESYPAFPYSRRSDTGGVRLAVRVSLIECPGCGSSLKLVVENNEKKFRCGVAGCARTWRIRIVQEPGQAQTAALVMEVG